MGWRETHRCTGCGYEALVSGGGDAGMRVATCTMSCAGCKSVVDVVVAELWSSDTDTEPARARCPLCAAGEDALQPWVTGDSCPRCGDPMPSAVGTGTAPEDEGVHYLVERDGDDVPYILYAISSTVAVKLGRDGVWRPINPNLPAAMTSYDFMSNSVGESVTRERARDIASGWGACHWGGGGWDGDNGEPGTIVMWD